MDKWVREAVTVTVYTTMGKR